MGKKLVQKVVKHTKFSEDDSAMSNGAKLAVGAVVTGFGLAGIYAAATPGGVLDFTGQKPIQKTGDHAFETGQSYKITKDQYDDLAKKWKADAPQGEFAAAFATPHSDASVDFKVIKTFEGKENAKVIPIPVSDGDAFLDDMVSVKDYKGNAHITPMDGDIVLKGQQAVDYADKNLSKKGNISEVHIKVDRNYVNGGAAGAAKVYYVNGTPEKVTLKKEQVDAAITGIAGNITKFTKKDSNGKLKIAHIGADVQTFLTLDDVAGSFGLSDQWGYSFEQVAQNIKNAAPNFDNGYAAGTWDAVNNYALSVTQMMNKTTNASIAAEIGNISVKIADCKQKNNATVAITYLTDLVQRWNTDEKEKAKEGLVPTGTVPPGYVPKSDYNGWVNNSDNSWVPNASVQDNITATERAILGTWRTEIKNTYSNVSGKNYLAELSINDSMLENAGKEQLWNWSQALKGKLTSDIKLDDFRGYVQKMTGANVTGMNESELRTMLETDDLADFVAKATGKDVTGWKESQLVGELNNYMNDSTRGPCRYWYDKGLSEKLENATAGSLLLTHSGNYTALDYRLNIIAGNSSRVNYRFTHSAEDTAKFDKFKANLTANNVTLPVNTSFEYEMNSADVRIVDTYGDGGIIAIYDSLGRMVNVKELTKKQMSDASRALYAAGIGSGMGDE